MSTEWSFPDFYARYAPRLWGIILLANLPLSHSEQLLLETLALAWQRWDERPSTEAYVLSWLIGLAHRQGLPYERVQALLQDVINSAT